MTRVHLPKPLKNCAMARENTPFLDILEFLRTEELQRLLLALSFPHGPSVLHIPTPTHGYTCESPWQYLPDLFHMFSFNYKGLEDILFQEKRIRVTDKVIQVK